MPLMPALPKLPKILLAIAVFVLASLAGEGCFRGWLALRGDGYSREATLERLKELRADALNQRPETVAESALAKKPDNDLPWSVHPYIGFDLDRGPGQIDKDLAEQQEGDETFDILLVGGSVAADFGWLGRKPLFDALSADPRLAGIELRLLNYARPAHKQPQQLITVSYLLSLGLLPDAVINLDGFNEVAVAGANASGGMHPGHPASSQWLPLLSSSAGDSQTIELAADVFNMRKQLLDQITAAQGSTATYSALLSRLLFSRIGERQTKYASAMEKLIQFLSDAPGGSGRQGPSFPKSEAGILEVCIRIWSETSLSLSAICASRGIPFVHVLQPTLHDNGSKPLSATEIEKGKAGKVWRDAAKQGYPLLRKAGADLRSRGVPFHDASMIFSDVEQDIYFDACHFGEAGNIILADSVAKKILEQL